MTMGSSVVLFDFDGTIVDSHPGIVRCLSMALRDFDLEVPDERLRADIGPPFDELLPGYGVAGDDVTACIDRYRRYYRAGGMFEATIYDGVRELLDGLLDDGVHLAVASSKAEPFVRDVAAHFGLLGMFEHVVGATLDLRRSSKADVIGEALDRLGAAPSSATMVGDRSHDVLGARASGVERTFGVLWGFGTEAELVAAGARAVVAEPAELARSLHMG